MRNADESGVPQVRNHAKSAPQLINKSGLVNVTCLQIPLVDSGGPALIQVMVAKSLHPNVMCHPSHHAHGAPAGQFSEVVGAGLFFGTQRLQLILLATPVSLAQRKPVSNHKF